MHRKMEVNGLVRTAKPQFNKVRVMDFVAAKCLLSPNA